MAVAGGRGAAWLVIVLGCLVPIHAHAQRHFPSDTSLETMLRYLVEDGATPGVALGVFDTDGSMRAVGYGSLDPRTAIDLGALTMAFTATLLGDMVARGEVALDDPAADYLPDLSAPLAERGITLLDLATHRSGLPPDPGGLDPGLTAAELRAVLERVDHGDPPGRRYRFSAIGYALLGQALATATGTGLDELLRERVLTPLGMGHTGYAPGITAMRGATGLHSSAEDMVRFVRANADPDATPLGRAIRLAHEIRVERGTPDEPAGHGFSWRTYSIGRWPPIVAHGGGGAGSTAMVALDPARRIGSVLLAASPGFNDWIARELVFFHEPPPGPGARVDPAGLAEFVGTYRSGVDLYRGSARQGRYFIRLEDEGYLTYQQDRQVRRRLYAESDTAFYLLRAPRAVTFTRDGDAVRLVVRLDERAGDLAGRSWTAWRVRRSTPPPAVVADHAPLWRGWGMGTWTVIALIIGATGLAILRSLRSRSPDPSGAC